MDKDIRFYAKRFQGLNTSKKKQLGVAPHKPILLLSVIELIKEGEIQENKIYLTPKLISKFLKIWSHLGSENHNSDISLPFFHLTGDGFWHLIPNEGFESTIAEKIRIRGLNSLKIAVDYAYIDKELAAILLNSDSREHLKKVLLDHWFSGRNLESVYNDNYDEFESTQLKLFESGGAIYSAEELKDQERAFIRNAAFRKFIVLFYDQTCAFCHTRVIGSNGQNIVDGAHIKPFSKFRDDQFINGLALCKNHHWAFDRGWFGVDDCYRIIIPSARFEEVPAVNSPTMREFQGKKILLPDNEQFYPSVESLSWHRDHWDIA